MGKSFQFPRGGCMALTIIKIAIPAIILLLLLVSYLLVSYMIVSEMTKPEEAIPEDSPSDYGVGFESVRFQSRRGDVALDGWYLPGQDDMPVIIFAHGIGAGRTGDGMTELAAMLNRRGFGALLFDFRAHGLSEGDRVSNGWHERLDILGAYDYLLSRGFAPSDIGLLGFSMGAGAAALAVAEEPDLGALMIDAPYADASEMVLREVALRTPVPKWIAPVFIPCVSILARVRFDIRMDEMSPERVVSDLEYPIMVIYVTEDGRVPSEQSQRVFDAAPEGSRLWIIEGPEHVEGFLENKEEYTRRVADYFLSRLRSK